MPSDSTEDLEPCVFERFSERAREVVGLAQDEAGALKHAYIGTEHILLGLLREEEGLAARVLESLDITVDRVRAQVVRIVGSGEAERSVDQIPFTPRAKRVFEMALREALDLAQNYINPEHILLALVGENEGVASRILLDLGAGSEKIRAEVIAGTSGSGVRQSVERASGPELGIDPGWLDGLSDLLKPLGEEIRTELGRAPDVGDLLLAVACVPGTPAAEALSELGIDVDQLWGRIERARARAQTGCLAPAERLAEVVDAKELAIEDGRFSDAAGLRDQERGVRTQARAVQRARVQAADQLRRRLGVPRSADDR